MRRAAVVALTLILVGCSGGDDDDAASITTVAPTVAATTTTGPLATVTQVASRVAESRTELLVLLDTVASECSLGCDELAGLDALTLSFKAGSLSLQLQAISEPRATTYIGEIPDEVRVLYDETVAAGSRLEKLGPAASKCRTADGECATTMLDFRLAIGELRSKLNAWQPYV